MMLSVIHAVRTGFPIRCLKGKKPDAYWLEKARIVGKPDIAEQPNISAGSPVFILKCIRDIDGERVSIEASYAPACFRHSRNLNSSLL